MEDLARFFPFPLHLLSRFGNAINIQVYLTLAGFVNSQGECWPSITKITSMTGLHRLTVMNHVKDLQARGLLTVEHRFGDDGGQLSNFYRLVMWNSPTPPESEAEDCGEGGLDAVSPGTPSENTGLTSNTELERANELTGRDSAMPSQSDSTTTGSRESGNVLPREDWVAPDSLEFQQFWEVYPNHDFEDDAKRAFRMVMKRPGHPLLMVLIGAAQQYARTTKPEFYRSAASWLRGGGWKNPAKSVRSLSKQEINNIKSMQTIVSLMTDEERVQNPDLVKKAESYPKLI